MDSKPKDDREGQLKILSSVTILIIIIGIIVSLSAYDKYETVDTFLTTTKLDGGSLAVFNSSKENIISGSNVVKDTVKNFNIKINGYAIKVDNKTFGYVTSKEQQNAILKEVCENYIRELGVDIKNLLEIQIKGKIDATPYEMNISELNDRSEIASEIYKATVINNNILGLKLILKVADEERVESPMVIQMDEELYMGESEVEQGTSGLKRVYKEIVYDGFDKSFERTLDEEILVKPTETIVKKGNKNPYGMGIEFLSRPTAGGVLSSLFGERRGASYHKGIDIAKNVGEEVNAAFDGEVVFAGYNYGGYGNLVIIKHDNNLQTYYAHLDKIFVSEGDNIEKDKILGTIGNTGLSTGPHLHFELRVNDTPVNPIEYIKSF